MIEKTRRRMAELSHKDKINDLSQWPTAFNMQGVQKNRAVPLVNTLQETW